jgi:hypothetical protein
MSDHLSLSQVAALMAYAATTTGGKTPALRGLTLVRTPSGSPAFFSRSILLLRSLSMPSLIFLWIL